MFMPSSLKKEAIWSLKCTQPKLVSINLVVFFRYLADVCEIESRMKYLRVNYVCYCVR
jgi:hypothetical protein